MNVIFYLKESLQEKLSELNYSFDISEIKVSWQDELPQIGDELNWFCFLSSSTRAKLPKGDIDYLSELGNNSIIISRYWDKDDSGVNCSIGIDLMNDYGN